ncbi:MAG: VWA domain-containing protein [Dysgonamonadaceae bacterium]|jgi:uncharacterized protein with von Willebrand factor type A (vWA) domain|nr:VWA domain-containing protein [Dysgonamonadaceae bacterium]
MSIFSRFIHFGNIANPETRKQIAENIFTALHNEQSQPFSNAANFSTAIADILNNTTLQEMCKNNEDLSEKITGDILDFVNRTQKQIGKTGNPFVNEFMRYQQFVQTDTKTFRNNWNLTKPFINKAYNKNVIDTEFYEKEFQKSFNEKDKNRPQFDSVKEHLTDKWSALFYKKQTDWELQIIDRERKKFCEELYRHIEELKKLQEILKPFTNELGRLWDMSKGSWQRVNFDILKHYADLLQKDQSLRELAEMLGRMRQAEQEYEEELFADIRPKTAWKMKTAAKSDLVGVHESDDISSALPAEFALLADSVTEMLFYKKFTEKKLQTFEFQGRTQEIINEEFQNNRQKAKEDAKGPFIICVDTSGSMHGTPETVAKTLCFAILKTAVRDSRKCYLISFSTGMETLNLTDLKNSLDKTIRFLTMSFHGGTDAIPAMREALRMLTAQDYKKADIIMVSDFVAPAFDETTQKLITVAKTNKTKFHSLVVGTSQNKDIIKDFDNNWLYDVNSPTGILNLVRNINDLIQ